ncbi:MAG TPA: hypothetical protein VKZ98_06505 [Aquaticitalea sp.]|nr:hypothetical protein [Aquaticitalea sp.]
MKYYKLEYDLLNHKETGTQFQCVNGYFGDIQSAIFPMEGKIDFEFDLPEPILENKAKPTTLLNAVFISNQFLVFKDYFLDFLKKFNVGEHQTWKIKVHHNHNILSDYSLFSLSYPKQRELIDFKKSSFYLGKYSDHKYVGNDIIISDYDNYLSTLEVLKSGNDNFLKYKKIVLDLRSVQTDMFKLCIDPLGGYYVSEKLKTSIKEKRFTGITFKEIEGINNKIEVVYQ